MLQEERLTPKHLSAPNSQFHPRRCASVAIRDTSAFRLFSGRNWRTVSFHVSNAVERSASVSFATSPVATRSIRFAAISRSKDYSFQEEKVTSAMISLSLLRELAEDISENRNSFTAYSHQSAISRIRRPVVKKHHGIRITSTRSLRTAGMSPETFGSLSKNRCRLRKIYTKATMFTVRKNVAAIRRAGRAAGLICASTSYSFAEVADVADDAVLFA